MHRDLAGLLRLVSPGEAHLTRQLRAFLAIGKIVSSRRQNVRIRPREDGTARVTWDWSVEIELRKSSDPIQVDDLPCEAIAKPRRGGGWMFAAFRSLKPPKQR